jgi:2-C-methyl-D-erythritol 4-phosphate cytidylyltransferase/2-C-methyl-D-erythritol 2,4-cyclodiphosphate synthase
LDCTDDTQVWDSYPELTGGRKVHIVEGDIVNKKITYQDDLPDQTRPEIRIGMGTDLHRLVEGRRFLLGGVEIPAEKGELGHSDADVLLHAITDALLGASGLGDIGSYFPPEEAKWKDADSSLLLKQVWADVRKEGWRLVNLDCVVEFERPKFLPWRQKVIESVASILGVSKEQVFVKAKTNEGLDAVGSSLAIKAYCVCLLSR